ncbi:DUT nucleotidohydrolase, partial [Corythaeola cristata]|nr:DUT nucleotidohydrolase [Corythaeola cristata]
SGSAGLDLAMGADVTITDSQIHVIPSVMTGPLGYGLSALLLGRSSSTKQGLLVLPGVIDANYKGPIGIMLQVIAPPVTIKQGSKITQLIPFCETVPKARSVDRGSKGFGSTGPPLVAFTQSLTTGKPTREVNILGPNNTILGNKRMLLDSGADVTIIP